MDSHGRSAPRRPRVVPQRPRAPQSHDALPGRVRAGAARPEAADNNKPTPRIRWKDRRSIGNARARTRRAAARHATGPGRLSWVPLLRIRAAVAVRESRRLHLRELRPHRGGEGVSPDYPEIPPEAFGGPPPAAKPFCSTRRDCARSLNAGKIGEERERLKVRIRTRQRTKAQRPFPRSDYFESVSTAPRKARSEER